MLYLGRVQKTENQNEPLLPSLITSLCLKAWPWSEQILYKDMFWLHIFPVLFYVYKQTSKQCVIKTYILWLVHFSQFPVFLDYIQI